MGFLQLLPPKKKVLRANVSPLRDSQSHRRVAVSDMHRARLRRDIKTLGSSALAMGWRVDGDDLAENPCLGTGEQSPARA